jgi:flagellar FliL protein
MMSKNEKTDETAAPQKSKKKLLVLVVGVLLLLGAGGAGYTMMAGSGSDEPVEPEPGAVVALDAVTINLADGHYLKVKLALQATADAHEEPDGSKALDAAIEHFSDMKMAELSSSEGRAKAKHDLTEKVSEAYEGEVMDIYYTEFVMQ